MVRYNIWQPHRGRLRGLRFALKKDGVEWLETLKVARLMPTISFSYLSSLVLNLSKIFVLS